MNQFCRGSVFLLIAFLMTAVPNYAADYTWIGGHGMDFNEAANWSPSGVPNSGSDSASITDSSVVDLDAANTVSTLTLGPGTLNLIAGGNLTTGQVLGTGTIGFSGGRLTSTADNSNFLNTFNVLSAGGATIDTQSYNVAAAGLFVDLGGGYTGGLTKTGTGTLTLTGANAYTGPTTISNGTLQANDGAGLPTGSLLTLDGGVFQCNSSAFAFMRSLGTTGSAVQWGLGGGGFANGGTGTWNVYVNGGGTLAWGDGPADIGSKIVGTLKLSSPTAGGKVYLMNNLDLGDGVRTIEVNNNDTTSWNHAGYIEGGISGTGTLVKTGPGRLRLQGNNSNFTGTTIVNEGFFGNDTNNQSHGYYICNGGIMSFCFRHAVVAGLKVTGGSVQADGKYEVTSLSDYDIQGGVVLEPLAGSVGLTKTQNTLATLTPSGAVDDSGHQIYNTYTGPTTISAGALQADDGAGLPVTSLIKLDGGVLQCNSSAYAFTRSLGTAPSAFQWTTNGGGFSNGSTGVWNITVAGGPLTWGDGPADVGSKIVGTLKLSSPTAKGSVNITNDIDLGNADRTIEVNNPDTGGTYQGALGGAISGTGGIIKNGPGRLRLNGWCSYTGTTTLNEGFFANMATHQPTGNYLVNGGTLCFCNKSPDKIDGLKTTGGKVEGLGGSILRSNSDYDIQGGEIYCITLTDGKDGDGNPISVGLTKTGNSVAKLECTCTYTGPTNILAGTLELCTFTSPQNYVNNIGNISSPITTSEDALLLISYNDDPKANNVHTVGTISGFGTTQVCNGATLIATSIVQKTLIIGGDRPPLLNGESVVSVPEPCTALMAAMIGLGLLAMGFLRKYRR